MSQSSQPSEVVLRDYQKKSTHLNSKNPQRKVKITVRDLNFSYGTNQILHNVFLDIYEKSVLGIIGPSGCGKSTFLRVLNRMNETLGNCSYEGLVSLDRIDVHSMDVTQLRRRVGMVFQRYNPFKMSVFQNVAFGLRLYGYRRRAEIEELVEKSLKRAALWGEVKDRLHSSAFSLSGGQQQRLCIARALAVEPEVLLMDEPASALDPSATAKVEELIETLKGTYTIVIVTHNMHQAARISDYTAFFLEGKVVEYNDTASLFSKPASKKTEAYINGHFG